MKITQAIQVIETLNKRTKEREIVGLLEAMEQYHLPNGLVITFDREEEFKTEKHLIKVLPIWKWLLGLEK